MHPADKKLLIHSRDNRLRLLDCRFFSVTCAYSGLTNYQLPIRSTISPDGRFIISGSEDGRIFVWNVDNGTCVRSSWDIGYAVPVIDVAWHPYDHIVAFAAPGQQQPVWMFAV